MRDASLPADNLNVLVVGRGGRESMIVAKLAASRRVAKVFCAPGNAGTAALGTNVAIAPTDIAALAEFARDAGIHLTIVGPADAVADGIVDHFQALGLLVFGPTRAQAVLETSKDFSKAFMRRQGIPTARSRTFSDLGVAIAHLDEVWQPQGIVIKVDGLADVQSTLVTDDRDEARAELRRALVEDRYGEAGRRVLIEERLVGPEVSLLAFVDGRTWKLLPAAQDHKPLLDGGLGPNTEGMGAYAPAPLADEALMAVLRRDVLDRTCRGLAAEGLGYAGVLFAGVLVTERGPMVLEYNCRFGDPETQVTLAGLQTDLVDLVEACLAGRLAQQPLETDGQSYVCVVAADPAYPATFEAGQSLAGLEPAARTPGVQVLHALTQMTALGPASAGGRVLNVVAGAPDLATARERAYAAIAPLRLGGQPPYYRRDIAALALAGAERQRIVTATPQGVTSQPSAALPSVPASPRL